ncbi:hypothetical protein SLS62_002715 [Diatrype stigma]|uniref:WLM domain-containing protein n=1 Tax=Diatrype stigma TaxID=117547 RepID=A0AAN9YVA9_9PEZI
MPVGIQRLNAKKSQPNARIVFIKPLKGPDEAIAQDFLERIAAQCEEYEPNREFVGRNFNAGEVVQLVLKSLSTGRWLPFHYVQMVMMHELAHCKQMNHSKAFWAVRNQYADQMRVLWNRSYTGEGLWGRGALLRTGEFENNTVRADEILPEHLCGGTYRSQRRKRKPKQQLSYQERKERRILKKFGTNGVALGEDEGVKTQLEKGKKVQAKPRVASSNRGRELRAAAALARFDQKKEEEKEVKKPREVIDLDDDETVSEADSDETASEAEQEQATVDINGHRMLDKKGHGLVKVCEDEDPEDGDAQNELRELQLSRSSPKRLERDSASDAAPRAKERAERNPADQKPRIAAQKPPKIEPDDGDDVAVVEDGVKPSSSASISGTCPMCSFDSGLGSIICSICSHVMDPKKVPGSWKCRRPSCVDSLFLNAGDSAMCGVCGQRKD